MFKLVPDAFEERFQVFYMAMGNPTINIDSFWGVYLAVYEHFALYLQEHPDDDVIATVIATQHTVEAGLTAEQAVPVPGSFAVVHPYEEFVTQAGPGGQDLREDLVVVFTSDEDDDDDDEADTGLL